MNQYYNYKKWRLSKLGNRIDKEGHSVYFPSYYNDSNMSKQTIDEKPENTGPLTLLFHPHYPVDIEPHINKLLENLKYAIPQTYRPERPELSIFPKYSTGPDKHILKVAHGDYEDSDNKTIPFSKYQYEANIEPDNVDSLHKALSNYAGASIFHVLHRVHDFHNDISDHVSTFPGIQDIQEYMEEDPKGFDSLIKKHSPVRESMFHSSNISNRKLGDFTGDEKRIEKPYSKSGYARLHEKLAAILGNETEKAYNKYLKLPPDKQGSFLDYVIKNRDSMFTGQPEGEKSYEPATFHEDVLHRLLVSILKGHHLADK